MTFPSLRVRLLVISSVVGFAVGCSGKNADPGNNNNNNNNNNTADPTEPQARTAVTLNAFRPAGPPCWADARIRHFRLFLFHDCSRTVAGRFFRQTLEGVLAENFEEDPET